MYAARGETALAEGRLALAQERFPTSPWIRVERARALILLGRREEAVALLREARSLALFSPEAGKAAEALLARLGG